MRFLIFHRDKSRFDPACLLVPIKGLNSSELDEKSRVNFFGVVVWCMEEDGEGGGPGLTGPNLGFLERPRRGGVRPN